MLGDFIPHKQQTVSAETIIDEHLDQKYKGEIKALTERLERINKDKITEKEKFIGYVKKYMAAIKTDHDSGAKECRLQFPGHFVNEKEVKLGDPLLELALNTVKDDLTMRGYTVTLLPEFDCDQRDQGYAITGSWLVFKVVF